MARVTKVELEQQLVAQGKALAAAREEVSVLKAEVERLRCMAQRDSAQRGSAQRDSVQRGPWQRPAHMEAAREAAMRLGKVVLVGGAA